MIQILIQHVINLEYVLTDTNMNFAKGKGFEAKKNYRKRQLQTVGRKVTKDGYE